MIWIKWFVNYSYCSLLWKLSHTISVIAIWNVWEIIIKLYELRFYEFNIKLYDFKFLIAGFIYFIFLGSYPFYIVSTLLSKHHSSYTSHFNIPVGSLFMLLLLVKLICIFSLFLWWWIRILPWVYQFYILQKIKFFISQFLIIHVFSISTILSLYFSPLVFNLICPSIF